MFRNRPSSFAVPLKSIRTSATAREKLHFPAFRWACTSQVTSADGFTCSSSDSNEWDSERCARAGSLTVRSRVRSLTAQPSRAEPSRAEPSRAEPREFRQELEFPPELLLGVLTCKPSRDTLLSGFATGASHVETMERTLKILRVLSPMSRRPSVDFDLVDVYSEEEEEEEEEDTPACLSICLFKRIPSQPAAGPRLSGEARSRSGILWLSRD
ncbi:hypothetical protein MHYP_G00156860 [Metynnis hypsauchen]